LAPYALSRELLPRAAQVIYHAVGGVDLDARDPDLRAEVLAKLEAADDVSVRDSQTRSLLEAAGLAARLMPDPAVMVRELFGEQIRRHLIQSAVAPLAQAFPRGYVAVQFSADFGDDETLREIAAQLDRFARSSGLGVVFFRAGAAPWHDELDCYEHTLVYMQVRSAAIFKSLNLWDICALLAASRAYCGSSLHGRIVTMAFALPRVNLAHPALTQPPAKQAAYAATWENPAMPATVEVGDIARGLHDALAVDQAQLERTAQQQVTQYREGFELIRARLRQQSDPPAMNAAR
jgi:polysaccharide pyruvyl transferase WcaK-like protein